ncbi:hypothetical protein SDC9_187183 [bioreactor metagenome]|uniref:Uncharacterized protein n=1 Tax=bioreactor metagenome TaxID=1076179 RepID=A0A645HKV4_9ZZZZ
MSLASAAESCASSSAVNTIGVGRLVRSISVALGLLVPTLLLTMMVTFRAMMLGASTFNVVSVIVLRMEELIRFSN